MHPNGRCLWSKRNIVGEYARSNMPTYLLASLTMYIKPYSNSQAQNFPNEAYDLRLITNRSNTLEIWTARCT